MRKEGYITRKQYLEKVLEDEWIRLDNKARFVFEAATGVISLLKRKKAVSLKVAYTRNVCNLIPWVGLGK